jgi:hypothetical protein
MIANPNDLSGKKSRLSYLLFVLAALFMTAAAPKPAAAQTTGNLVISNVNLTSLAIVDNALRAEGTVSGTLAGVPFTTNITDFVLQPLADDPGTAATECAVLNLELAPIHIALLGLYVDTSAICLDITATQGGGLLGDLLCSLAGGPGAVAVPAVPTGAALTDLVGALVQVLNAALGGNPARATADGDSVCTGECEVLDLVLGPLDLSLLGLNVSLDNCDEGPVEICVSASRGAGILGDLLCGLAAPRLRNLTLGEITQFINRAAALATGGFTRREIADLRSFLNRLAQR